MGILKSLFNGLVTKIKSIGASQIINSLDQLEKPLGEKLEVQMDKIRKMIGYGLSVMFIDMIQELLRDWFKIPQPKK